VKRITIREARERVEHEAMFQRSLGYDLLTVTIEPL